MILAKYQLKIILLFFLIIGLASVNVSYFLNIKSLEIQYSKEIDALKNTQAAELDSIKKEIAFYQITTETKSTEPSPEDQTKIDYINSGYDVNKIGSSTAADCSAYERPWRKIVNSNNCAFLVKNAVGNLKLLIVGFAAPNTDLENDYEIKNYKNDDINYYESYNYIKTFFEREAKKFNANFSLQVDKTPIIQLNDLPKYSDPDKSRSSEEMGKTSTFFLNEFAKAKIDIRDYDAINILIMGSRQYFTSLAIPSLRATVNLAWEGNIVVTHETAHIFGAKDQYIEGKWNCYDGTYDEYITSGNESLMCRTGSLDPNTTPHVLINKWTAKDIGWINED